MSSLVIMMRCKEIISKRSFFLVHPFLLKRQFFFNISFFSVFLMQNYEYEMQRENANNFKAYNHYREKQTNKQTKLNSWKLPKCVEHGPTLVKISFTWHSNSEKKIEKENNGHFAFDLKLPWALTHQNKYLYLFFFFSLPTLNLTNPVS